MTATIDRPDRASYAKGVAMLLMAGVVWSMMGLGVRYIQEASSFQILFYRSLGIIPALILFITIQNRGRIDRALRQMGTPTILGSLALVFAFGGSIISLKETTVANAVFLLATAPFFAAILGRIILGERVRAATWITIFVGSFGVAIMVYDGLSAGKIVGNVAAIICAIAFSVFTIALRYEKGGDTMPAVLLGGFYAAVASGVAATVAGQPLMVPVGDALIAVALGVGSVGLGLILYTLGSRRVPAAESTLLSLTEVVLSPIWVWILFGETAGPLMLVGGGILLVALFGNALTGVWRERRLARQEREVTLEHRRPPADATHRGPVWPDPAGSRIAAAGAARYVGPQHPIAERGYRR
ncbi:MAG: DMT family transporter [Hyphomicrobiaceae bacterium]